MLLEAAMPNVIPRTRDAEEPAGPADIVRGFLIVLQHAESSLDLACLLLPEKRMVHSGRPVEDGQDTVPVGNVD